MEKEVRENDLRLNLPAFGARLRRGRDGRAQILDVLRRKYVALTPEEWVRQHFVHYLISEKGYPTALLVNETEVRLGEKRLRCDSVMLGSGGRPRMIIEYKAPTVPLSQRVFDQIAVYNLLLRVDYLIVSNGIQHVCCRMDYDNRTYRFLADIPGYEELRLSDV